MTAKEIAIEKHDRLESETESPGTWIRPQEENEVHHSVEFDGYEHVTACGESFDEPPFNVYRDPRDIPRGWPICLECLWK